MESIPTLSDIQAYEPMDAAVSEYSSKKSPKKLGQQGCQLKQFVVEALAAIKNSERRFGMMMIVHCSVLSARVSAETEHTSRRQLSPSALEKKYFRVNGTK